MPSKPKTTRVAMRIEVEVDAADYELAYGVPPEDQAEHLVEHVGHGVEIASPGEIDHRVTWRRLAR